MPALKVWDASSSSWKILSGSSSGSSGSGLTITSKTSGFTAAKNNIYLCNTSTSGFTCQLPTGTEGDYIEIWDYAGTFGTNNLTIAPSGSDKINGIAESLTVDISNSKITMLFMGVTRGWQIDIGGNYDVTNNIIDYSASNIDITSTGIATLSRLHSVNVTGSDASLMLPVLANGKGVEVIMALTSSKLLHISVGSDAITKAGTVVGGTSTFAAGTGTISTAGSSTTVTGIGTSFTTQLRVGDMIHVDVTTAALGRSRRVVAIASNTSLTVDSVMNISTSSFFYSQTGILGTGTSFSTDYAVGDGITIGNLTRKITYINGANSIGVDLPFLVAPNGSSYGKTTTKIDGDYYKILWADTTANKGEKILVKSSSTNWDIISYTKVPSYGAITNTNTQSISINQYQKIVNDTLLTISTPMTDIVNSRIKIFRTGTYILSFSGRVNSTTHITYYITRNTAAFQSAGTPNVAYVDATQTCVVSLNAGDVLTMYAWPDGNATHWASSIQIAEI